MEGSHCKSELWFPDRRQARDLKKGHVINTFFDVMSLLSEKFWNQEVCQLETHRQWPHIMLKISLRGNFSIYYSLSRGWILTTFPQSSHLSSSHYWLSHFPSSKFNFLKHTHIPRVWWCMELGIFVLQYERINQRTEKNDKNRRKYKKIETHRKVVV